MARRYWIAAAVVLTLMLTTSPLWAVPGLINYQGKLTDGAGNALSGSYEMNFLIYTALTGGTAAWSETQDVTVTNGIYSVKLGDNTPLPVALFADSDVLYLEVQVKEPSATTWDTLVPRQQLTSTAFAMKAAVADEVVDGAVTAVMIADGAVESQKLGDNAVTGAKIADGTVSHTDMQDGAALAEILDDAGSGSGLDADKVDGHHASDFALDAHSHHSLDAADGSPADALYVNNDGKVGVGTTNPQSKLSLGLDLGQKKLALWDGVNDFYGLGVDWGRITISTNDTEKMTIRDNGNVGIGIANPGRLLHLYGTSNPRILLEAPADQTPELNLKRGSATASLYVNAGNDLVYYNSGDKMILTDDGKLGIGTTNPDHKLHVAGNSKFEVGGGSIAVSTPGGWPGVIAYSPNGHRRDIQYYNDSMSITMSDSSSPSPSTNGIRIYETGRVALKVLQITGGSDLSEQFDIRSLKEGLVPSPGMVVSIDPAKPGDLVISSKAYDRRVAGIISGAGGVKPGMLMGQRGTTADGLKPVALSGRVYCRADASNGPIEPGDLLTTSDTPGHAMKVTDYSKAHGAVIGKAITSLKAGTGLVLVLVSLQ